MDEVKISKSIWDTMVYLYFGNIENPYKAASVRAYLDLLPYN